MNSNQVGIILIILGMSLFAFQDVLIKSMAPTASLMQILFFRGIIGTLLLSLFFYFTNKKISFSSSYPAVAIARGTLFFVGFTSYYVSLTLIPLAEATSLFFISPLFMTIFSKIILKDEVGFHRFGAIIFGFLGILLIIKPSFQGFNWAMLLPILCAATYSLSMILAKLTSNKDTSFQQTSHIYISNFILAAVTSLVASHLLSYTGTNAGLEFLIRPFNFTNYLFLFFIFIISIFGTLGILCLIMAYRIGSPSANSPCEYIFLLYALLIGYFIFSEVPDLFSLLGMVIIFISGVYIFIREGIRSADTATNTSLR